MKEIVMKHARLTLSFVAAVGGLAALTIPAQADSNWSEISTGAAAGYCLGRHPYIAPQPGGVYTAEGFEVVTSPGVAGAVRRNYVFNRRPVDFSTDTDQGGQQTCAQACSQWGLEYGSQTGKPLRFRASPESPPVADGIGDMAATAHSDADFYIEKHRVIAGISGRPLNYQEGDVAQADFCCCQLRDGE
jgi:hypothetical protein